MKDKKGFTLIELLVVILIIGILAAIALPQYQRAVFKSKMKEVEVNMTALYTALELYYLANGRTNMPQNIEELEVSLSGDCVFLPGGSVTGWNTQWEWDCKNYTITLPVSGGEQGRIVTKLKFVEAGSYGHFSRNDQKFMCTDYIDRNTRLAQYCKDMGYPITNP